MDYLDPKPTTKFVTLPVGVEVGGRMVHAVQLREITGVEEEVLAAEGPLARKLTEVIASCAMIEGTPATYEQVMDMANVDRMFLLLQLRAVSLGDMYQMRVVCPACGATGDYAVDITKLEVLAPEPTGSLVSPGLAVVTLPKSGKAVTLCVATGRSEELVQDLLAAGASEVTVLLYAHIRAVDGASFGRDKAQRKQELDWLRSLSMADRNRLRGEITHLGGKLDTDLDFACASCGHEHKGSLELSADFFFPSAM